MLEVDILVATQELTQNEFDALLSLVSNEKKDRIKRFYSYWGMQNSLIGDVLVRLETCCITGYHNKQLAFSTTTYGKPFLANNPNIQFSISHAGYYIAVLHVHLSYPLPLNLPHWQTRSHAVQTEL